MPADLLHAWAALPVTLRTVLVCVWAVGALAAVETALACVIGRRLAARRDADTAPAARPTLWT